MQPQPDVRPPYGHSVTAPTDDEAAADAVAERAPVRRHQQLEADADRGRRDQHAATHEQQDAHGGAGWARQAAASARSARRRRSPRATRRVRGRSGAARPAQPSARPRRPRAPRTRLRCSASGGTPTGVQARRHARSWAARAHAAGSTPAGRLSLDRRVTRLPSTRRRAAGRCSRPRGTRRARRPPAGAVRRPSPPPSAPAMPGSRARR